MRLLVTGGSGFIGSSFVELSLNAMPDASVVNVDNLTYASIFKNDFAERFGKRYLFARDDITDAAEMRRLCKDADMVVNFAAETHVDNSIANPGPFVRTNVLGTSALLDAALNAGHSRFFHISTDEVYGSSQGELFKESAPMAPSSPYSASKAAAEMMVMAYERTFGIKATITRSSNNYGPGQHPEKFIPRMITRLAAGRKIPIYGSGENVRDWLHVSDNCEAIRMLLEEGHAGIFNVAAGHFLKNIEVAGAVLCAMGKGEECIEHVDDRKGHDFRYAVDTEKIRALGWKPKIDFGNGIKDTVDWYIKNKKQWAGNVV